MSLDPEKCQPMGSWVLCTPMKVTKEFGDSGLVIAVDEDKTVSEGVAIVVATGPGIRIGDSSEYTPCGVGKGDHVIYRGFLRFAMQIGDLYGKEKRDLFLIKAEDLVGVVEGTEGTIGHYNEFVF